MASRFCYSNNSDYRTHANPYTAQYKKYQNLCFKLWSALHSVQQSNFYRFPTSGCNYVTLCCAICVVNHWFKLLLHIY